MVGFHPSGSCEFVASLSLHLAKFDQNIDWKYLKHTIYDLSVVHTIRIKVMESMILSCFHLNPMTFIFKLFQVTYKF